ncbi:MAG: diguanylate cyclase (GGDEF)-like protein [Moritella sp.]|jgi:diguanylate cyclase (GGDEF)-like protein
MNLLRKHNPSIFSRRSIHFLVKLGCLLGLLAIVYPLLYVDDTIRLFLQDQNNVLVTLPALLFASILLGAVNVLSAYKVHNYQHNIRRVKLELTKRQGQLAEFDRSIYTDFATGLPNRFELLEILDTTLAEQLGEDQGHVALCILDLDDFRYINDTLGHTVGDQVIAVIAQRLKLFADNWQQSTLVPAYVSRIGGDEFALLVMGIHDTADISPMLQQLLQDIRCPIKLSGRKIAVSASIGVSISPEHGSSCDALLKKSDMALYKVKNAGKHNVAFFKPQYLHELETRVKIEQELMLALQRDEFELYYQPIIDVATEQELGFEALIRWHHPVRGLVSPDDFIPVAEDTGLIVPMGQWIIKQVCCDLSLLQIENRNYYVAINIAPQQLADHAFVQKIRVILDCYLLEPGNIHFEITETTLMNTDNDNLRVLREINNLGIKLWIDDFGTGYSSFSYLNKFRFHGIKLDRSFIENVVTCERSQNIVKGICAMGEALKLELLGEGIEQLEQADFLLQQGCNKVQGYWYAEPMSLTHLNHWLTGRDKRNIISVTASK